MKKLIHLVIAVSFFYSIYTIVPGSLIFILFLIAGLIGYSILTKNKKALQPVKVRAYRKY